MKKHLGVKSPEERAAFRAGEVEADACPKEQCRKSRGHILKGF